MGYGDYYHRIIIYFDGASRNNPRGPAGCGWTMYEMDNNGADSYQIASDNESLGYNVSNNQAEYRGLTRALEYLSDNDISCQGLYIRGDSEIVINQLLGDYNVRSRNIIGYYNQAVDMINEIQCVHVNYRWIPRDKNWEADDLANNAIDH